MGKRTARRWSEAEDRLIRENPGKGPSWEGWAALLPDRTEASIARRRQILGVQFEHSGRQCEHRASADVQPQAEVEPTPQWTDEQVEALLDHSLAMVKATGHSIQECMVRLAELVRAYRREAA